jgi:hypothetical protein
MKGKAGPASRRGMLHMEKHTESHHHRTRHDARRCGHWVEVLQDLPDLRWAKVTQARQNIMADVYEREDFVEGVLPTLAEEVGAVLREDLP